MFKRSIFFIVLLLVMKVVIPKKLKKGDNVLVVAPSRSFSLLSQDTINNAIENLQKLWLNIVFWKNINQTNQLYSSSIKDRIDDIHWGFREQDISAIISVIWGSTTNQIIPFLDYDLIKRNPKIISGFSDITVLHNAVFSKTWMMTYYWPHFSSFGAKYWTEYVLRYFQKCCMEDWVFKIEPSEKWSDDEWYLDQEKRNFYNNSWYGVLQEWSCSWRILGWNLECFSILMGTPYFPLIEEDCILCIEQDSESEFLRFIRWFEQLSQTSLSKNIKWLVLWRFQTKYSPSEQMLKEFFWGHYFRKNIPIVFNFDFWHTQPLCTLPLWWFANLDAYEGSVTFTILEH